MILECPPTLTHEMLQVTLSTRILDVTTTFGRNRNVVFVGSVKTDFRYPLKCRNVVPAAPRWASLKGECEMTNSVKVDRLHPGEAMARNYMAPAGLSIHRLALAIGVSSTTMERFRTGQLRVTSDLAQRLGSYFGTTPDFWIQTQREYDAA